MTKDERNKLAADGVLVLRTASDKKGWRIRQYTLAGGWKNFDDTVFFTRDEALKHLNHLIVNLNARSDD
ncbi:MAG: hypothetical protein PHU33_16020 [Bacteroidales bacterium]|nr:hypothetical protein [Bacteroidales bacterium]